MQNPDRYATVMKMLRVSSLGSLALMLTLSLPREIVIAQHSRPNIVLIIADDLEWKDVGFNGSDYHETPVLDRFAKEFIDNVTETA